MVLVALLNPVIAVAALLTSGAPAPAAALPPVCGELDLTDSGTLTARADAVEDVFVGSVTEITRSRNGTSGRAPDAGQGEGAQGAGTGDAGQTRVFRYAVDVEAAFRGIVDEDSRDIVVTVTIGARASAPEIRLGRTYLFFVDELGAQLIAEPCTGVVTLPGRSGGLDADTEALLTATLDPAAPSAVTPTLEQVEGADEDPPALSRMLAPGGALALIGLLGLMLVSRLGRERH